MRVKYTSKANYRCTQKILYFFIAILFSGCQEKTTLPDPLEAGWKGMAVCEVLEENEHLRTLKCTFPAGVGHERHYHPTHFGYTLVGGTFQITDTTGTREVEIPTGTHFYNDNVDWHEVINIGDSTSVFLIMEPK